MQIVSVVRNFEMFERLVKNNPYNKGADCVCFDNNQENLYISVRYNQFLNNYDYGQENWLVFCHEDWEIKENWQDKIAALHKDRIYGVVGVTSFRWWNRVYQKMVGKIEESQKDGSQRIMRGEPIVAEQEVETFDCQCLIVHSSLIKKHNLRFDEKLMFDLYAEEFSINARENFGIGSYVVPVKCQHYSSGDLQQRFFDSMEYIKNKYKHAKYIYGNVVYPKLLIYNQDKYKKLEAVLYKESRLSFWFSKKITKKGYLTIKICKIPVWHQKIKSKCGKL